LPLETYARVKEDLNKTKSKLQNCQTRSDKLERNNEALVGMQIFILFSMTATHIYSSDKYAQQHVQTLELDSLNCLLGDELCWYESQEALWARFDKNNQVQLAKLNREILSLLHLYGEIDQQKAKNLALQEKNARLQ
jgi:hypothetical protein